VHSHFCSLHTAVWQAEHNSPAFLDQLKELQNSVKFSSLIIPMKRLAI
jgi:hypothetical protein